MSTLRGAAQQALELRRLADKFSEGWHDGIKIDATDIMLLVEVAAALEQPEQEPVAWIHKKHYLLGHAENMPPADKALAQGWEPLFTHPPRRETEQEQEPVATVTECEACFTPDVCRLRGTCDHYSAQKLRVAHPPRREWQSLMPDDVFASDEIMAANASLGLRIDQLMDLVHAVEQALKERNT